MDQICLKRVFKTKNVNTTTEFYVFELVQVTNFGLNWQFWFFRPNLPERGFQSETKKSKHHHLMMHIWINLRTKFQLNLQLWCFEPNLPMVFLVKSRKIALVRVFMFITILNFSARVRPTQRCFNVSSFSSRRDNETVTVTKRWFWCNLKIRSLSFELPGCRQKICRL